MKKKNSDFLTGVLVGAAITLLLTRRSAPGVVVLPTDKPEKLPAGGSSIGEQPYNPFRYLPGDLGRQLPAIYANP